MKMLLRGKIILPSTLVWLCLVSLINGQWNNFRELPERFFQRDHSDSDIIRAFLPESHQVEYYHTPKSDVIFHFLLKNSDDDIRYPYSSQYGSNSYYPTLLQIPKLHFDPKSTKVPASVGVRSIPTPTIAVEPSNQKNKKDEVINSPKPLNLAKDENKVLPDIATNVNTSNQIEEIKFPVTPATFESNDSSSEIKPFTGITDEVDEDEDRVIPIIPIETALEGLGDIFDFTPTERNDRKNQTDKTNIKDKSSVADPITTNSTNVIPPEKQPPIIDDILFDKTNDLPYQSFDNLEDLLNRTLPNTTTFINTRSSLPKDASSKYKENTLSYKPGNILEDKNFLTESDPGNPPAPLNQQPNTLLMADWLELSKQMYHKLGPAEKKRIYEANKAVVAGKYSNPKSDDDGTDVELKPLEDLYLVAESNNIGKDKKPGSDLNKNSLHTPSVETDSRFDRNYVNVNNGTSKSLEEPTSNKNGNVKMNNLNRPSAIPYAENIKNITNNNSILPETDTKINNIKKENNTASNLIEPLNNLETNIISEPDKSENIDRNDSKIPVDVFSMFNRNVSNKNSMKNSTTPHLNKLSIQNNQGTNMTKEPTENNVTKHNLMKSTTPSIPTDIFSMFDRNFNNKKTIKNSATLNVSGLGTQNNTPDPKKNNDVTKYNWMKTTTSTIPTDLLSIVDRNFNDRRNGKKSATPNVTKNRNISKNTTPTIPVDFLSVFDRIFNNDNQTMNNIRNFWTSGSKDTNNKNVTHPPIISNTASKPSPAGNEKFTGAVIDDVIQRLLRSAINEVVKSYTEYASREWMKTVLGK